ncbi:MAG: Gfo/Idh/MocA family oxidoreductase [Oscillospiraceae bacterium]
MLKILFTGIGSIGTRHLKNLHEVAQKRGLSITVDALRSGKRELNAEVKALINREYTSFKELGDYDIAFITNPTNLHFDTLRALRGKAKAFFIEKPIFDKADLIIGECINEDALCYVAAPMRFCGTFIALKNRMENLRVYSARVICSSYLPEWRKGVDYRTVYSAHKEMGGGVTIDLIHEWDYLTDLFGVPKECFNLKGTYSDLEIDSDDLSVYIAKYDNLLAEVHLDYFGREYKRSIELFCPNGTVCADFGAGTLTLENGEVVDCREDVNMRYIREINYFLDYFDGKAKNINPPSNALNVLKLTLGDM